MNPGRLVAFEGIDGCGKSTQLARAVEWLRAAGRDVVATREPTDGEAGRRIRAMARSGETVAPERELAWFLEDRREHVEQVIAPALAAGRIVLTDRYTLSTVAYQGARGLDWRALLDEAERDFPRPDLALVFVVPAEVGLARVRARGGVAEPAFEERSYLERVAEIFAALDAPYVTHLEAGDSETDVARRVDAALEACLGAV